MTQSIAARLTALYDAALTTTTSDDIGTARGELASLSSADVRTVARLVGVQPASAKRGTIARLIGRIERRADRHHRAEAFSAGS